MRKVARALGDDVGLTLAELLVAATLLGVIITGAFAGMAAVRGSDVVAGAASTQARDMANPLEMISKMVMQNNGFNTVTYPTGWTSVTPTAYSILIWTNQSMGQSPELDAFYANSSKELVWERWKYDSRKTTFTTHVRWVMSTSNANVQRNVPLFRFYDGSGDELTDMSLVPARARVIIATTVSKLSNGAYAQDSRTILFRNRN